MDPKVLILVPGLVVGWYKDDAVQSARSLPPRKIPAYEWPDSKGRPDRPEQEHPYHEDPSPMYRGMVYSNINVSNTANLAVSVDSSASASGAHLPGAMWPENNFVLVSSIGDLQVNRRLSPKPQFAASNLISPSASKHLSNPSTVQIRESITRRRG